MQNFFPPGTLMEVNGNGNGVIRFHVADDDLHYIMLPYIMPLFKKRFFSNWTVNGGVVDGILLTDEHVGLVLSLLGSVQGIAAQYCTISAPAQLPIGPHNWETVFLSNGGSGFFSDNCQQLFDIYSELNSILQVDNEPIFDIGDGDLDIFLYEKLNATGWQKTYYIDNGLHTTPIIHTTYDRYEQWGTLSKMITNNYSKIGYKLVGLQEPIDDMITKYSNDDIVLPGIYTTVWEPIGDKGHGGVIRFNI